MIIDQKFGELPTGEWTLLEDDMLCELSYLKKYWDLIWYVVRLVILISLLILCPINYLKRRVMKLKTSMR